ncbi:hypothetical protein [Streptomyces sp. NPDC002159]
MPALAWLLLSALVALLFIGCVLSYTAIVTGRWQRRAGHVFAICSLAAVLLPPPVIESYR